MPHMFLYTVRNTYLYHCCSVSHHNQTSQPWPGELNSVYDQRVSLVDNYFSSPNGPRVNSP